MLGPAVRTLQPAYHCPPRIAGQLAAELFRTVVSLAEYVADQVSERITVGNRRVDQKKKQFIGFARDSERIQNGFGPGQRRRPATFAAVAQVHGHDAAKPVSEI
ncbi:MAG: hypothetical protein Q7R41_05275 [Phycisphaerales bacterium]|nr:hypothetical protein [Phycisphaerales bacterium]